MTNSALIIATLVTSLSASAHSDVVPRIANGFKAGENDAPWQVYLKITDSSGFFDSSSSCGGTIIDDRWILTASHCLDSSSDDEPVTPVQANDVLVYSGSSSLNSSVLNVSRVRQVILHPEYNKNIMYKDVALIELESPVPAPAQAIKMMGSVAQANADIEFESALSNNLFLSGWGVTVPVSSRNNPGNTDELQKALFDGVSDAECAEKWGATEYNGFANNFLCANAIDMGSCNGDSGGPLVWQDKSHASDQDKGYRLAGVVSFGHKSQCANNNYPDVYTQVSSAQEWIRSHIWDYQEPNPVFEYDVFDPDQYVRTSDNGTSGDSRQNTQSGEGAGGSTGILALIGLAGFAGLRRKKQ